MKCKVCSLIEGHDKLLVPKLDSSWKHDGQTKVITNIANVATRVHYYYLKINQHVLNEHLYVQSR
jgi:hypothetical protein